MADDKKQGGAIRKRQQIHSSGRMMFIWVAVASAVVGIALIISWFLFQQIMFKSKVLAEKHNTVSVLKESNQNVSKLQDEIRLLSTNNDLNSVKAKEDDKALQVILDALPAEENILALGASIQNSLIGGLPDVKLDSISYETSASVTSSTEGVETIGFNMVLTANDMRSLWAALDRIEKSIRVIDIDNMVIEKNDNGSTLTVAAHAYYLPEKRVELVEKVVKP